MLVIGVYKSYVGLFLLFCEGNFCYVGSFCFLIDWMMDYVYFCSVCYGCGLVCIVIVDYDDWVIYLFLDFFDYFF